MAGVSCKLRFLTASVLIADLLFAGAFFGWPALEVVLKQEGQFAERCAEGSEGCPAQDVAFTELFVRATTVFSLAGGLAGVAIDSLGPVVSQAVGGVCSVLGAGLFAISGSQKPFQGNVFQYSFGFLIPFGSAFVFFSSYSMALLHEDPAPALTAVSSLFDSSTIVFPVLRSLHDTTGTSRETMFLVYTGVGFLLFSLVTIGWLLNRARQPETAATDLDSKLVTGSNGAAVPLKEKAFTDVLLSFELRSNTLFICTHLVRSNAFIAIQNRLLNDLGDPGIYKVIFGYALPLGALFVPVINFIHAKFDIVGSLQIVNIWGILVTVISMVPVLQLQAVNGVLYTGYRAILFSTNAAYCGVVFGDKNMGKVMGLNSIIGAIVNFVQDPLLRACDLYLGFGRSSLFVFNLIFLASVVPVIPLVEFARRRSQAAQQENNKRPLVRRTSSFVLRELQRRPSVRRL